MGRRYVRDNRGRFARTGATARGGRLATAAGNKRATQTAKLSSGGPAGTIGKPRGLKPGSIKPKAAQINLTGKGRSPQSKLPAANSDAYKWNKSGLLATPAERARMRNRDRAREKNEILRPKQMAGELKAQRRAARALEQGRLSTQAFSSTANLAKTVHDRRVKRASENFGPKGVELMRVQASLTAKAKKIEAKAAERKAAGKAVTANMQAKHAELRRQIIKVQKSQATRRRALEAYSLTKARLESNIRGRYSRNFF